MIGEMIVLNKLEHIYKIDISNEKRCKKYGHSFENSYFVKM